MAIIRRHKSTIYGLQDNLDTLTASDTTEAGLRASGDAALQTNIDNEATTRATADTTLQGNIDTVSGNLTTEISDRAAADTAINSTITALKDGSTSTIADLDSGISTNATAISTETAARIAGDNAINSTITALKDGSTSTIAQIDASLATKLEAADVPPIVISYTGVLTDLDTTNQNSLVEAINEVKTTLGTSGSDLQAAIDAEAAARAAADTTLTNNLNSEITRATTAEATLQSNIDAEAATRAAADTALSGRLDIIEGAETVEGSVAKAEYDAKAYADSILAAFNSGDFATLEALVATINGDSDTEGSFRKAVSDVIGTAPETLDTLNEIAAALNNDPDVYNTLVNLVNTSISNLNDEILGTATTAMDTLGEVEAAIAQEVTDRTNADTAEANARAAADTTLQGNIDAEEAARIAADNSLQSAIDALESAVGGDTGDLADLTTDAKNTIVAAINEVDAHTDTNTTAIATNATAISDETTARIAAVSAEASARTSADTTLQGNIDAEETARIAGDNAINTTITNLKDGSTSTIADLDAAIATNATAISTETTNRTNADNVINSTITALKDGSTSTIADLDAAIATNATAISTETTNRTNADTTLQGNIDAEEAARIAGDALALKIASNLSDLNNVATARTNLGVYSTSEVDSAISTASASAVTFVSESVVVSGDLITLTNAPKNGVIFNFNTVRFVDENSNSFDIEVSVTATAGGKEFQLTGVGSDFDTKTVKVQYAY